jgi:hypothetical protein
MPRLGFHATTIPTGAINDNNSVFGESNMEQNGFLRQQAVAQMTREKMLLVSCDSHKPSGDSFTPDGFSELNCEAAWATARKGMTTYGHGGYKPAVEKKGQKQALDKIVIVTG